MKTFKIVDFDPKTDADNPVCQSDEVAGDNEGFADDNGSLGTEDDNG